MKYRCTSLELELDDPEAMYDQMDSPPVPVAVGSPACAKKSFDTTHSGHVRVVLVRGKERSTIEECVEVIVIDFA